MNREFYESGRKVKVLEDWDCLRMSISLKPNEELTEEQAEQEVVRLMNNEKIQKEFNFIFGDIHEMFIDKTIWGYNENELVAWQVSD